MQDLIISIIQSNLSWENKKANLKMFEGKLTKTAPSDLIILPEMFTTGFSMQPESLAEPMNGKSVLWMIKMAAKHKACILGSLIIIENGNYFNRLIAAKQSGEISFYDKRHLFSLAGEEKVYCPGKKQKSITLKGWRIGLFVCYDLRFPVWTRSVNSLDVMVFVANWPAKRQMPWSCLLKARAIENQAYTVGVNRFGKDGNGFYHSGNSAIHSPLGETLISIDDKEDIETLALAKEGVLDSRKQFPFYRDADKFKLL